MTSFPGFPDKMRFTPIPNLFFSQILPKIDDIAELKTILHIFWSLYQKKGYPRFITFHELLGDKALMAGLGNSEALRHGLERAISRGTLLHLTMHREGGTEDIYLLNTEVDRKAVARIASGEISLGALPRQEPGPDVQEQPNIFAIYEENIGMLTPMIAEELKEAENLYPAPWIESAFREAVSRNKRNWRYISRILERWASEGREDGAPGRDIKEDRDKYVKGRYGHLVKRRLD
jgi:DnaD/phage-associated family protein